MSNQVQQLAALRDQLKNEMGAASPNLNKLSELLAKSKVNSFPFMANCFNFPGKLIYTLYFYILIDNRLHLFNLVSLHPI